MLGWLFLRNPRRLAELLDHLEKTDPLPPSHGTP
jgi:ribonuclease-3 family protein